MRQSLVAPMPVCNCGGFMDQPSMPNTPRKEAKTPAIFETSHIQLATAKRGLPCNCPPAATSWPTNPPAAPIKATTQLARPRASRTQSNGDASCRQTFVSTWPDPVVEGCHVASRAHVLLQRQHQRFLHLLADWLQTCRTRAKHP